VVGRAEHGLGADAEILLYNDTTKAQALFREWTHHTASGEAGAINVEERNKPYM
jgi:hypothetical protein